MNQYPSKFQRITQTLWIFLLLFNIIEYALEWLRALYALLYKPLGLPFIGFLEPFQSIAPTLISSHIGLLLAIIVARAIAFLTPTVTVRYDGLMMVSAFGNRFIPFSAIRNVLSTELPGGRYVVWIDSTKGLPLQGLLGSLLFGRWMWRGFLLTSDLAGFDNLVGVIAGTLKQKYGEQDFTIHFIEAQPTWLLSMLAAPRATIHQVIEADELPIDQRQSIWMMISASVCLAIPAIVSGIINLQIPWTAIIVPLLALIEFPLASLYLTAVPFGMARRIEFEDALRAYPLTQLPRWWVAIGLTVLVIAGVPSIILLVVPLFALVLGSLAVIQLTEEWFHVSAPESWLGALVTVIFQLGLYELLVIFLPR